MKPFFDTNVLLYLIGPDLVKGQAAEALVADGGTISVQILNEFVYVASRKYRVPWLKLHEILGLLRGAFEVSDLTVKTHDHGLGIAERYRYSIFDSMIIAAAIEARSSILYSEDMQHGQRIAALTIRNPFAA